MPLSSKAPFNKECVFAGLASAAAFFLVVSLGLGSFFLFLPSLPLFLAGLRQGQHQAVSTAAVASGTIAAIAGLPVGISFLIAVGIPAWYIVRLGTKRLAPDASGNPQWHSVGYIFLMLFVFASAVLGLVTLFYALQPVNLPSMIEAYVRAAFAPLKEQFGESIELLAVRWSFLTLAITMWVWGSALYAHVWFAHMILARKNKAPRPSMAVIPFVMPSWVLSLLGICALASLIGGESAQFLGKALLIGLAFPYFLLGISLIHRSSQKWPNRKILLFILYFFIFAQFWPVLLVSGWGLWYQVKNLNKHLPAS